MTLTELLRLLGEENNPALEDILQTEWEKSVCSEPEKWDLLQRECWRENRQWCGCEERCDAALEGATALVATRPELHLLAWHCHRLVFDVEGYNRGGEWIALIPVLDRIKAGLSGVFFLWLALGAAPRLRRQNKQRAIPDEITKATLWDIGIVQRRYARYNHNEIGVQPRLLYWHRLVSSGDLHRVGRFEYIARPFRGRLRAFRNNTTAQVMALSLPEVNYNAEGYLPYTDEPPAWTSTYTETESTFTGNPVSPRGFALRQTVELPKTDWQEVLAPDDLSLEIHIPEGEALTEASCRQSFAEAIDFYTTFYPQYKMRSFVCYSWLFNTQFETLFSPNSNVVAWQREVYLFPVPSTGRDGLYFVFGQDTIDPKNAPRDSYMRRAIIDHLHSGKKLRSGGMFFLFDDLEKYGTQFYRAAQ